MCGVELFLRDTISVNRPRPAFSSGMSLGSFLKVVCQTVSRAQGLESHLT